MKSPITLSFAISCCLFVFNFNANAEEVEQKKTSEKHTLVYAGTLLAVPGQPPKAEQTLVIESGKIKSSHDGYLSAKQLDLPQGKLEIIDLRDQFVLPGLIDAHMHMLKNPRNDSYNPVEILTQSNEQALIYGVVNARTTLEKGYTTVRDLAAAPEPIMVLRDSIKAGFIVGPRMFVAGAALSPTGGHGDVHFISRPFLKKFHNPGLCDGVDECRSVVREQYRRGVDLIKVHATGGGAERSGGKYAEPSFTKEELEAIVSTAHDLGLEVTAHAHATEGIKAALRAGVDSVEHASFVDKEAIRLFKKTGAYMLPTLAVQERLEIIVDKVPRAMRPRIKSFQNEQPKNVLEAYKSGVKIAAGSDVGVVAYGRNAVELEWLVKIGISEMEAIKIGTINTADHIGMGDQIGTLEPGKLADVIAVAGNPLEDISELHKVTFVMKEGAVYKQ